MTRRYRFTGFALVDCPHCGRGRNGMLLAWHWDNPDSNVWTVYECPVCYAQHVLLDRRPDAWEWMDKVASP